jgi:hypothetical protein
VVKGRRAERRIEKYWLVVDESALTGCIRSSKKYIIIIIDNVY